MAARDLSIKAAEAGRLSDFFRERDARARTSKRKREKESVCVRERECEGERERENVSSRAAETKQLPLLASRRFQG